MSTQQGPGVCLIRAANDKLTVPDAELQRSASEQSILALNGPAENSQLFGCTSDCRLAFKCLNQ